LAGLKGQNVSPGAETRHRLDKKRPVGRRSTYLHCYMKEAERGTVRKSHRQQKKRKWHPLPEGSLHGGWENPYLPLSFRDVKYAGSCSWKGKASAFSVNTKGKKMIKS